jgi:predicted nucleic acid-binding protein
MIYALDTCTVIELFKKNPYVSNTFIKKEKRNKISYPPVVYYEILRGIMDNNAQKKINEVKTLYDCSYVPEISEREVMEKSAEIYIFLKKQGITIGSDDIFIVAWCLIAGATLVTDNLKHFKRINGLKLENWKIEKTSA